LEALRSGIADHRSPIARSLHKVAGRYFDNNSCSFAANFERTLALSLIGRICEDHSTVASLTAEVITCDD